jgi:anti-anti-sigma factor
MSANVVAEARQMSQSVNVYHVARNGVHVYVRAIGLANMKNAQMLDAFLRAEMRTQVDIICVDLSACTGMDSTFMGLMVGTSGQLATSGGKLVVINPTDAGHRLLGMLGVTEVIPVVSGCDLPELEFVALEAGVSQSQLARMEVIQRAHQSLAAINEANRTKFAAFLVALEADLGRHGATPPKTPLTD